MTAAVPIAAQAPDKGAFSFVSIDKLEASATNPRKTFDPQRLAELAKTIGEHGVLEPILVRPLKAGGYEIVAGERRWRAARIAKRPDVPVIVRDLTDKQALEIQTIENAQREDLHPLEQADGYERLIKDFGYTPEKIADAIGKSRAHVFQIRKLRSLTPKLREAFTEGEMDTTLATVVARVPGAQLQEAAWQKLKLEFRNGFSFRVAADFIRKNFMLDLMRAPFNINDEKLVDKAGPCGTCPKRTGNQSDLFPDVRNGNVCTDPVCFHAKRAASQAKEVKTLEAKGVTVITGDAARRIFPHDASRLASYNGFASPDEKCYEDTKGRTYRQLAKEADLSPVKVQNPHTGALHDAVPVQALKAALQKTSITLGGRNSSPGADRADAARRATERRLRLEAAVRRKIFEKTVEHCKGKLGKPELVSIATGFFTDIWHEFRKRVAGAWGWEGISGSGNVLQKKLSALSERDLARFLISLSIVKGCSPSAGGGYTELLAAAKRAGLKPDAIRRDMAAQAKAAAKPKPNKLMPAEKISKGTPAFAPSKGIAVVIGTHPITRNEALKRVSAYIRGAGLTDKKKKRITLDDKLKVALRKALPHIGTFELREMVNAQLINLVSPAKARRYRPISRFMQPMQADAVLAVLIGDKPLARTEVTKKIWGYIKRNRLQDKKNPRLINTDEKLRPILNGKKQLSMFEMTKAISKHLKEVKAGKPKAATPARTVKRPAGKPVYAKGHPLHNKAAAWPFPTGSKA